MFFHCRIESLRAPSTTRDFSLRPAIPCREYRRTQSSTARLLTPKRCAASRHPQPEATQSTQQIRTTSREFAQLRNLPTSSRLNVFTSFIPKLSTPVPRIQLTNSGPSE